MHIFAGFHCFLNDCIYTQCTADFCNYCSALLWHKTSPSTVQSVSTLHSCQHGKQLEKNQERNTFHIFIKLKSDNYFRKSVMIWYIIDSVADHVCGHVDIFWLFVCLHGKEPADCKLILETVSNSMLTRAKALPPGDVSLMALQPQLFHWDVIMAKLVIVAHVGHVSHVSSMQ